MDDQSPQYSVLDLVQATGIARRTIRYYVQRELLSPPLGAGRGHYYVTEHLERLLRIRELQDRGLTLDEIRVILERGDGGAGDEPPPAPEIDVLTRIRVQEGLDIIVGEGIDPPTLGQIRALARAAADILGRRETRTQGEARTQSETRRPIKRRGT